MGEKPKQKKDNPKKEGMSGKETLRWIGIILAVLGAMAINNNNEANSSNMTPEEINQQANLDNTIPDKLKGYDLNI